MITGPHIADPVKFFRIAWPHLRLYDKQREILYSVRDNVETVVPAGHQLGKDFISAVVAIWFFRTRTPCRVVTTSVQGQQLEDVLWGEIRWLLRESKVDLDLQYNHLHIRQNAGDGSYADKTELRGKTVAKGEALAGYHLPYDIPRTLAIFDEASGISDSTYDSTLGWTRRRLIIGNPYPCENFFKKAVDGGDIPNESGPGYYRKIIRIAGADSPNVRLAEKEIQKGLEPSGTVLIPGTLGYCDLKTRLATWDDAKICAGIYGQFYEGAEIKLFPPEWLMASQRYAEQLANRPRKATSIGIDPAEGGDSSVWSIGDELGLIKQYSRKTPNTMDIPNFTIDLIHTWNVDPENVYFDAGGGGKQHADYLRSIGYNVQTVAFGASASEKSRDGHVLSIEESIEIDETRYIYKNRRAELYGELRLAMSPIGKDSSWEGFTIPAEYAELFRQLKPLPLLYDGEGRLYLPPKTKRPGSKVESIQDMIGCSPDEADSLVLMNWGLVERMASPVIGSMI